MGVGFTIPDVDLHPTEDYPVVTDRKAESSSSSSSDSEVESVLPTEDGEKKKKKVKKIKVKKKEKPKEKKEKKPKEKKEKKKKDKSFKVPDIDGGLTIDTETPVTADITVHADTEIPVESVGISLPELDVDTEEHVIVKPDHKFDSSSSSSSDSDDEGVLPTEDGDKKKKVKKVKVKKEKQPKEKKEKKPKEKKEKKKKDKSFKIPDIDGGLTIGGEITDVDDVTVHTDAEIPVESVQISLPEVDVDTEEHIIVRPDHKSDSSSSSSSDSDDEGVLPTEDGEKKRK